MKRHQLPQLQLEMPKGTVGGAVAKMLLLKRSAIALLLLLITTIAITSYGVSPTIVLAEDPLSDILRSRDLQRLGKHGERSRLRYRSGPWFRKNSNFKRLFEDASFAPSLIDWIAPLGKQFKIADPYINFAETHIHADTIVEDRDTKKNFALTVLLPHPAFLAMIQGKLVPDFAQREPPDMKILASSPFTVQGYQGTLYQLASERCSLIVNLAYYTMVEVRSIEECADFSSLKAIAETLNLLRYDQRLQS